MVKNCEVMYNRLGTIPACDGETDGRTDILPRHSPRYTYASRGKSSDNVHHRNNIYCFVACFDQLTS